MDNIKKVIHKDLNNPQENPHRKAQNVKYGVSLHGELHIYYD
jgi:hypothetical protein